MRRIASSTSASGSLMTKGGVLAADEDLDLGGAQLDLAGGELVVLHAREALGDGAADAHHVLAADALGDGVGLGRVGIVDDDLGDAVAVAQVEEDELAEVAAAVDPAGERGRLADVLETGVSAGEVAVGGRSHGQYT